MIQHWSGRNFRTVWIGDNDKTAIDVMSWEATVVGTEVADHVCGEQRTRNYFQIDHWKVTLELQQSKLEALKACLKLQEAVDTLVTPLQSVLGLSITFNDGTSDTIVMQDISVDAWSLSVAGRTDRNKFSLPMRCNILKVL